MMENKPIDRDKISVIAFDADDTLWMNEPYFRESEERYSELLSDYLPPHDVNRALLRVEIKNIPIFGYGVKSFILSMIETAMEISNQSVNSELIEKIIEIGKEQLEQPVNNLDGVQKVLEKLNGKYRLVMATKGDLKEQEHKLLKSGLESHFHHIEILSEKKEENYAKLISHLDVPPDEFLMIGNSLKSDIIPVLNLGGWAFHVPFHTTWEYEKVDASLDHKHFRKLQHIEDALTYL